MLPSRACVIAATLLATAAASGYCLADETVTTAPMFDFSDQKPARGSISLGYQTFRSEGSLDGGGADIPFLRNLVTETQSMTLSVNYRLAERWSLYASLPYIRKRALNDPGAHNPDALAEPRPDSEFLDDGRYHGTWQDWQLGVSYHTRWGAFDIHPHAVLTYPSRDYTFFASAAAGQRLTRFRLGFDASRRLGRSNFHYSAGYSYEFVERVLDTNLDKHHFRLSGRYDFSPQLSATVFASGRRGHGLEPPAFFREHMLGSERWYQHDRLLRQNYAFAGIGATWRFNETWSVSGSTSRMVWGNSIHDVEYAHEVQLTRAF